MKPPPFDYARPDSLEEALALLAEYGPDAVPLAGGMSLGAMLNMRLARPGIVVDLGRIPGLDAVDADPATLRTGAMLRQADAMAHRDVAAAAPLLARVLPHVGHFQTRNRGTLGGSVAHADPSAEIPLSLVAAGGSVALASRRGMRELAAERFFEGVLATARAPDELVAALLWPRPSPRAGTGFAEVATRRGDFAIVAAAAVAEIGEDGRITALRFALGGVEDRPRAVDCGGHIGAPATAETARALAEAAAAAVDPMEDLQADADFRRALVRDLGARALADAFADAAEGP